MNENTPFETYLLGLGAAENTRKAHQRIVQGFLKWSEAKLPTYELLMEYIAHCQNQGNATHTIRLKINSLKHYCDFLLKMGGVPLIHGNPAVLIKLQGGTRSVPNQLFSPEELIEIYAAQSTNGLTQKRDKVLLSLVVFQGIGSSELSKIEVTDIDLMQGTVRVLGGRSVNERILELKPQQLLLFQEYLTNIRPEILREAFKKSNYFLVNAGQGEAELMDNVISKIIKRLRNAYPRLKNLQQIRQSVITNWLNHYDLRTVQYMAGHRFVSSTERYKKDKLEGLKNALKMHYVLQK